MDAAQYADSKGAKSSSSTRPPRILIIGAGSRGNAYARGIQRSSVGRVVAVAEPIEGKRKQFGKEYIWGNGAATDGQSFANWKDYLPWERRRREKAAKGEAVPEGVDGVFICTLDETHAEIVIALAPLRLHILCEKPLATTLKDCLEIFQSLLDQGEAGRPTSIFAIGHVLRYSPHNMLLRKLLLDESIIGEIFSVEHTEQIGWWHFAHSYVRGNWRKESTSAPSLLTKSCHDIDLLLWLLCSPVAGVRETAHQPSTITSTGSLVYFKKQSKPPLAGTATNCLSCASESQCMYSAKKIYHQALMNGITGWPVKIVVPEIEQCLVDGGLKAAEGALLDRLAEDYDEVTPEHARFARPWFGRCVYEAGNDVCDDQFVTMTWEDDSAPSMAANQSNNSAGSARGSRHRNVKRATFHMVALTEHISRRKSRFYGSKGELEADSKTVRVHHFATRGTKTYHPHAPTEGHGGGDDGLARQFLLAIDAVKNGGSSVQDAQRLHIGCTLEEIIRSHAMVFAAEDARKGKRVVDWQQWWQAEVERYLGRE